MKDEIVFRSLEKKDLGEVKEFTDSNIGKNYYSSLDLIDIFNKSQHRNMNASFVAIFQKEIIGIRLTLAPTKWARQEEKGLSSNLWNVSKNDVAYFKSLFVKKNYQKLGVGKKLSSLSTDCVKKMGALAILCHSWLESPNNSSQRYLKSIDFEVVANHEKFWNLIDYDCSRCAPDKCICTGIEMIKYLGER